VEEKCVQIKEKREVHTVLELVKPEVVQDLESLQLKAERLVERLGLIKVKKEDLMDLELVKPEVVQNSEVKSK